jgi:hypothetical protein
MSDMARGTTTRICLISADIDDCRYLRINIAHLWPGPPWPGDEWVACAAPAIWPPAGPYHLPSVTAVLDRRNLDGCFFGHFLSDIFHYLFSCTNYIVGCPLICSRRDCNKVNAWNLDHRAVW